MNLTGDTSPMPYIENTFAKFDVGFSSTFNDDHGPSPRAADFSASCDAGDLRRHAR